MPVLDLDGLTRYDGNIKNYIGRFANWQKSQKAGAVAIYPVPETVLEPIVDFLFTESSPASGTKGPDNPSTITGRTSFKLWRAGKNLLPPKTAATTINGVTFTPNSNGSITVTGTPTGRAELKWSIYRKSGITYSLSGCPAGGANATYFMASYGGGIYDYGEGTSFTTSAGYYDVSIVVKQDADLTGGKVFWPQLEIASAPTAFEPYEGANYTVNLGGIFYGGFVDLSTGVMTVTHVMVEPDSLSVDISAHPANAASFQYADTFGRTVTTDGNALTITGETGGQIVYNLATPETVSLTPTQIYSLSQPGPYAPRLNTIYSDQTSVQVGYVKSPIRSEYELTQAILATQGGE